MKTKVLLVAGTSLLLTAVALVLQPAPQSKPVAMEARKQSNSVGRISPAWQENHTAAAKPTAQRQRSDAPREMPGNDEDAVDALLAEVSSTYGDQVQAGIARLVELPSAEHDEELAEIGRSVADSMNVILENLGIDENRRAAATAAAADTIVAEIQYAEAAPDPASRLALLWLDRERQVRADQALALTDPAEQSQALAELEAWHADGLGGIIAANDPSQPNQVDATSSERR